MKSVNFDHSLSHTLFQHAAEMWHILYIFLVLLYLALYSAPNKNVTYIIFQFQVLRVKIVNFDHSLTRTLLGTQQKCDFRTFFCLQSEKSQFWSFSVSNSTRHAAKIGHTLLIFLGFETENHQVWSISILYSIQHLRELRQIFYPSRPVINVISVLNSNLFCKRRILINGN